jgi:hypothetical protein
LKRMGLKIPYPRGERCGFESHLVYKNNDAPVT